MLPPRPRLRPLECTAPIRPIVPVLEPPSTLDWQGVQRTGLQGPSAIIGAVRADDGAECFVVRRRRGRDMRAARYR
eukprot:360301-Chlamydomonas_euryale.AAC.6